MNMDNYSLRKSTTKSTVTDLNPDMKIFVKLSSKEDTAIQQRVFFFEDNREQLILQKGNESLLRYKYDYIFSDYENTLLIASMIRPMITSMVRNEKSMTFFTFGEERLGKTRFMFGRENENENENGKENGSENGNSIQHDSFFKYIYDQVLGVMSKEFEFDNILIDVFNISKEKFVLDYVCKIFYKYFQRNVAHDLRYDIVEVINQVINDAAQNFTLQSGHMVISLKFFKFISDSDINKEQREVEIIRTFHFVDIEGFDQSFTNILIHNNADQPVSAKTDPTNYSLISLKNLIESLASKDLEKYTEVNSTLTSLISDILRTPNSLICVFGFIDQYNKSILESTVSLEILNKFKYVNPDLFFSQLQEMNIDISQLENKFLQEEFHIVELIFSEMLYYIEKSYLKNFNEDFFTEIKEMEQEEKYNYLKAYLEKKSYNFLKNPMFTSVMENVFNFFQSRAKWRCLYTARDDIIKLSLTYKETDQRNTVSQCRSFDAGKEISVNETDEIRSVLKNISKILKNVEENEQNNSIFDKISENQSGSCKNMLTVTSEHKESIKGGLNKNNVNTTPSKSKAQLKTTIDTTSRHSMEASFTQEIFKSFLTNLKKSFVNIYSRLSEEDGCLSCNSTTNEKFSFKLKLPEIDFTIPVDKFKNMKATSLQKEISLSKLKKKSKTRDNHVLSQKTCTKMDELYKNQETHFKEFNLANDQRMINTNTNKQPQQQMLSTNQNSLNKSSCPQSEIKNTAMKKQSSDISCNNDHLVTDIGQDVEKYPSRRRIKISFCKAAMDSGNVKKSLSKILNTGEIDINLSRRISKINDEISKQNVANTSQCQSQSSVMFNLYLKNLDSRVRSVNDMSEYNESRIIKAKSFLSFNY